MMFYIEMFWRKGLCRSECWILLSLEDQEIVPNSLCMRSLRAGKRHVSSMSIRVFCALGWWDLPWAGMLESRALGGHGEHSGDAQAHAGRAASMLIRRRSTRG